MSEESNFIDLSYQRCSQNILKEARENFWWLYEFLRDNFVRQIRILPLRSYKKMTLWDDGL